MELSTDLRGLQNKGENNCFINVVIQSLWNIKKLQESFVSNSHSHDCSDCITCEISVRSK
jgi:ubiquitin C-terminal hydrolase